jgi:5-methylcytosine-specific restriction endonuclease McrA
MVDVLSTSVLVLNRFYSPINITTARRAFIMLFNRIAEVITVEEKDYNTYNFSSWAELSEYKRLFENNQEHEWVFTPNLTLLVPRIVRVLHYGRVGGSKIQLTRRNIYYRDNNTCQYCGKRFKTRDLNIDHVVARSRGGKEEWGNLVCACVRCNIRKGNKLPHEAGMKLIRKPMRPKLNPLIMVHLAKKKYASWKNFLDEAYWNVELQD